MGDFTVINLLLCIFVAAVTYGLTYFVDVDITKKSQSNKPLIGAKFRIIAVIIVFTASVFVTGGFPDVTYDMMTSFTKALETKLW